jgi:hypothetical protein
MLYNLRDAVFNRLICWLMEHCHCWSMVFYTACRQYYPKSTKNMFECWWEEQAKGE